MKGIRLIIRCVKVLLTATLCLAFCILLTTSCVNKGKIPLQREDNPEELTQKSEIDEAAPIFSGESDYSTKEIIDYFKTIAMKSEYNDDSDSVFIRKWEQPILVELHGDYSKTDYSTFVDHIDDLNQIPGMPEINIVETDGNYHVYFVPLDELIDVVPGYVENNWGFIQLYWANGDISEAYMGIGTDVTNQKQRNHLILEEFTQGLGLLNDSPQYMDSIFQIEWTETQELSELDFVLIEMLYGSGLEAGMDEAQTVKILEHYLGF